MTQIERRKRGDGRVGFGVVSRLRGGRDGPVKERLERRTDTRNFARDHGCQGGRRRRAAVANRWVKLDGRGWPGGEVDRLKPLAPTQKGPVSALRVITLCNTLEVRR